MAVWADAGVAEIIKMKARMQAAILLCILELYMVPDFEFIKPGRVDLQDIPSWTVRRVGRPPGARQDSIHHNLFGIDPNNCQVHENEQHVDGRFEPALARLDEQQTLIWWEVRTEHQAAQATKETFTVLGL